MTSDKATMTEKEFCDKYGKKYKKQVPQWFAAGYLGAATKDEKTGVYSIPCDIPLPYSARSNVTQLPTLWRDMLLAASKTQSLFETMYPKLAPGVFSRQLQEMVDSGFIRISKTESGDPYLELRPAGFEYMTKLNDKEKKHVLDKVAKLVQTGATIAQAITTVWPYIQPYISSVPFFGAYAVEGIKVRFYGLSFVYDYYIAPAKERETNAQSGRDQSGCRYRKRCLGCSQLRRKEPRTLPSSEETA